MPHAIVLLNGLVGIAGSLFFLLFFYSSVREKAYRAAFFSLAGFFIHIALWLGLICFIKVSWVFLLNGLILVFLALIAVISFLPFFPPLFHQDASLILPFDERDHMFSRNNLKYFPNLAEIYYGIHPENKEIDQRIHTKPDLHESGHLYDDPYYSPMVHAAFSMLEKTRDLEKNKPGTNQKKPDEIRMAKAIRAMAQFYGAADIGYTRLKPHHFYNRHGRHAQGWGELVQNSHPTAIVIVVAMSTGMMNEAPALPVILESSRQYVEAAKIANLIAEYIRSFGYSARAHTDGHYDVLCVPLAIDAGLGVLGRIGLLMHPILGPCIRLSVVTTDLSLPVSRPRFSLIPIEQFCKICKKCAKHCPTQSICLQEPPTSRGFEHWSINQETCYSYWKNIGTDCGYCVHVCPYSKPDTLLHRLVRYYISRNTLNQRLALFMDNFFYGPRQFISNKNPQKMIH